ncbi:MAG: hypothetical protein AB1497_02415 [Bacillota bacterium]
MRWLGCAWAGGLLLVLSGIFLARMPGEPLNTWHFAILGAVVCMTAISLVFLHMQVRRKRER